MIRLENKKLDAYNASAPTRRQKQMSTGHLHMISYYNYVILPCFSTAVYKKIL